MQETHTAGPAATELLVRGMSCNNCARHVTDAIQNVPGVRSATVLLETGRASVRWNSGTPQNVPAVVEAVQKAGYEAKEIPLDVSAASETHRPSWQINLWLGVAVTAVLMVGEWGFRLGLQPWFQWLSFALAGAVQIFAGAQFYRGAWNQLKIGSSNMDTLVALGSTTAFGYSAWALLGGAGGHLYFMEAAAIITLISLGHWLEARVSDKAGGALKSLLNLAPYLPHRLRREPKTMQHAPRLPHHAQQKVLGLNVRGGQAGRLKPRKENDPARLLCIAFKHSPIISDYRA